MSAVIKRVAWTAETQHGYVTRAQAIADGASDVDLHRAVSSGVLERVGHGVYRVVGAQEHPHPELWAAWLALEPGQSAYDRTRAPQVWVSHTSAARTLDLGETPADVHEFSSTARRQTRRPDVRFHRLRRPLTSAEWVTVDGLPVTSAARTVADLVDAGVDRGHVGWVIVDALDRGLATEPQLLNALSHRSDPAGELEAMVEQATGKFTRTGG